MSLSELISGVESYEKTLTVFNADEEVVEALRERFADRNLTVTAATTEAGPRQYAVLGLDGEFVTAISVSDALTVGGEEETVGFADAPYQPVVDQLDETMFTSYSVRKMVAASREIEDRAWRVGRGELHAGFQTISTLVSKNGAYGRLGDRDGLDVHVYAYPDEEPPAEPSYTLHTSHSDEIRDSWFVAFDGGGVDESKCALVAEEREPRQFYGFWTYDADTVDYVLDHLQHTYALNGTDGGPSGSGSDGTPADV